MKRLTLLIIAFSFIGTVSAQETVNTVINTLKERIKVMGYVQAGYTYTDDEETENTFDLKRSILMVEGKVTDKWFFHFQYNFNAGGTVLEVFTDYQLLPGMSARFGQFKLPYTIEGTLSTTVVELINCYSQATNYLTAISGSHDPLIGGTGGRDMGLMVYGNVLKNKLTYHLAVINGQGINTRDRNNNKDIVGSLMIHPEKWLSVGGSFIKGKGNALATSEYNPLIQQDQNYTRDRWGVGAVIKTKPVSLRTEYLGGKDGKVISNGYYATASFHVAKDFNLIASYDYFTKNKDMNVKQTNYVAGVEYWFYPRCRVQAQYTFSDKENKHNQNMIQAQIQVRF